MIWISLWISCAFFHTPATILKLISWPNIMCLKIFMPYPNSFPLVPGINNDQSLVKFYLLLSTPSTALILFYVLKKYCMFFLHYTLQLAHWFGCFYSMFHVTWTTFSFNRTHLGMVSSYIMWLWQLPFLCAHLRDYIVWKFNTVNDSNWSPRQLSTTLKFHHLPVKQF